MVSKSDLRKHLRKARREHVAAQSDEIRALLLHRPPAPLLAQPQPPLPQASPEHPPQAEPPFCARWTLRTALGYGLSCATVLGLLYALFKLALQVPLP